LENEMSEQKKENLVQLLQNAQQGDRASLQELCKELERYIRGYFRQKFQSDDIIDDLAQETYIRLLGSLAAVHEPMKLRSFVTKVAVHVTQDYFRQKYRRREESIENSLAAASYQENDLPEAIALTGPPDRILNKVDLEKALSQLPEKSRQIVLMSAEGYKYEEIAEELELSVSGVKMQIKRSLEKLRLALLDVTFLAVGATIIMRNIRG
jgi:RNA polymerase sigma-70 factor (ECF subfamily)